MFTGYELPLEVKQRLEGLGYVVKIERPDLTEDELIAALDGAIAYLLGGSVVASRRVIESAKSLKVIAYFGVGYEDSIEVTAATEYGIAVTNTPGANAQSVAEFTIVLMLDAVKRLSYLNECTKQGNWLRSSYRTRNIRGKCLGVVGLGRVGSLVARIARRGFDMDVLYTARSPKPDLEVELGATFVTLDELVRRADIISLHVCLNDETRGMIGKRQFDLMKSNAILVNTARAALVDSEALYDALQSRRIAGAAFDVYYEEPIPAIDRDKYKLVGLSSEFMLLSPHVAFLSDDSFQSMFEMNISGVIAVLEGRPTDYVVNPEYIKYIRP